MVLKINKTFIKDVLLNIIATMLPIAVLQFISLPYIGSKMGAESYGEIIFLISVFTLIAFPFGNVLNNVRLLSNKKYEDMNIKGDFNFLVIISTIISVIIFLIYSTQNNFISLADIILILIIIILSVTKEYFIVSFRLVLNFKKIFFNNIFLAIGYLLGTCLFSIYNQWEFIYLTGLILSNIYIYKESSLVGEGFKRTVFFKGTLKDSIYLYLASLIRNLITQADKLLLFPLLGPQNVAIYYSSSIIGRIVSMFVNPVNSVVLSYLAKTTKKIKMMYYLLLSIVLGTIFYFLILLTGPLFLKILYNSWYEESVAILKYTAAISVVSVIANLFQPINMRFNELKWQLYINGSYLIVYLSLAIVLTKYYGLKGFAVGVLIGSIYNFVVQVIIYYFNSKTDEENKMKKENGV